MINLLKYYFKKRLYIIGILSIILILLTIMEYSGPFVCQTGSGPYENLEPTNNPLSLFMNCSFILCIIIPLFEFSFKMRKVGVDQLYSFPIKKRKLYITKFIIGYLEIIIPFTVCFIFMLLRIVLDQRGYVFHLEYYFIYYLLSFLIIFVLYSYVTLFYVKCNTIYDGVICVIVALFLPSLLISIAREIMPSNYRELHSYLRTTYFGIYNTYYNITDRFKDLMDYGYLNEIYNMEYERENLGICLNAILGIISFVLFVLTLKFDKAENSMDISNSWFSYKILIPILILASMILAYEKVYIIIVGIVGYIMYAIYRRNFKIKKIDILMIIIMLVLGVIVYNII